MASEIAMEMQHLFKVKDQALAFYYPIRRNPDVSRASGKIDFQDNVAFFVFLVKF